MGRYNPFELRRFIAPEFLFGSGAIDTVDRYIKNLGAKKAMIVTDPGVIKSGWAEVVERFVKNSGINFIVFSEISPNAKDIEVMQGAEISLHEGCDLILAVGGGSVMDCAKGIAITSSNQNILDFEGIDNLPITRAPLICIPTTAGTSADLSQFAVIRDSSRKLKITIAGKATVPDVSLIDPITTTTMTPELTASTGFNALCNAFESYVSNSSSPVTDINALKAVKLISHNLVPACEHHYDLRYRDRMMLASLFAGLAFSNASPGIINAMSHALGGLLDLPHGECSAILLEDAIKYNFYTVADRYSDLAQAMGVDIEGMGHDRVKDALLNEIASLRHRAGITHKLGKLGVKKEMLPQLSKIAIEDPCLATNPREASPTDIEGIYEKAL